MEAVPSISIIIPTRNRLKFLQESVASVVAQSFRDWELIVIDDASEDGTWAWLRSIDDARIRVLRLDQHRERSAARNTGFRVSRGEFVLFLDDDDWLLDGALARLRNALRRRPSAVGAVGAYIYKNDWGSWNRAIHPRHDVFGNIWTDLLFGWVPMMGQSLLRRSVVVEVGGWNEAMSLGEDYEFSLRIWRLGPAVVIPQPVLAYRLHPGQTEKGGAWALTVKLRLKEAASREPEEKRKAEQSVLAHRLIRRAWRALQRGEALAALGWWWRGVSSAPWLLASPPSRAVLLSLAWRCFTRVLLGSRAVEILRKAKRACVRTLRGELRAPPLAALAAKGERSLDQGS